MAILETKASEKFIAGAPDIILKGDLRPKEDMKMAMSDDANERALEQIFEQLLEEGFSPEEAAKKAREIFNERGMADGGRIGYSGGSYKDRIQNVADEIAQEDYGQDFYDLGKKLQDKVYERAMRKISDAFADKADMMRKNEADGGRAQYGLGSLVKGIKKAVKGVAKGVGKVVKSPLGLAALNFAPMLIPGGKPILGFGTGKFEGMFNPLKFLNLSGANKGVDRDWET